MTAGFFGAFLHRASTEPDRVALVIRSPSGSRDLTHAAIVEGALRWAGVFRTHGAKPGNVVLLSLDLSADLIHAFMGALSVGCVPSFMPYPSAKQDSSLFWASHNLLFGRLGGGLVVTSTTNRSVIAENITDAVMIVVTPEDVASIPAEAAAAIHQWRSDEIACLQHSSGTTGLKKGVALSFDLIAAQIEAYVAKLGIGRDDVIVSWLPLYHDMGFVACLLMPLTIGATSVLLDPFDWLVDPLSLFDAIEAHAGTFVWLPNFAFAHLVNTAFDDERRVDLTSLRAVIDCSEACRPETLDAFGQRFSSWGLPQDCLQTCYAMAETVFAISQSTLGQPPLRVCLNRVALEENRVVPIVPGPEPEDGMAFISSGTPLPGVDLAILDRHFGPVGRGFVGQIAVKAPFLFGGYHLAPERPAAVFREGFYLTGDLGFRIDDDVFVVGRRDDLLIVLGRNVFAHEIEAILSAIPGVKPGRALALAIANEALGSQELVVLAELNADKATATDIKSIIRVSLSSMLGITPKKIMFVENGWLIKSTSGKINRAENYIKYLVRGNI